MTAGSQRWVLTVYLLAGMLAGVAAHAQTASPKPRQKVRAQSDSAVHEVKGQVKTAAQTVRQSAPDSVPSLKKSLKQAAPEKPDSVGVSYENGKWKLPGAPSPGKPGTPDMRGNPEQGVLKNAARPSVSKSQIQQRWKERGTDSLDNWADRKDQILADAREKVPGAQYVPSRKAIQKIYDSLGISRLDSIRAMTAQKTEVTPDALAQALKLSFPAQPGFLQKESANPTDMVPSEGLPPAPDLSALKLSPESMMGLPAIPAFQLPTDSIPLLDSLRKLNLARQRLSLQEHDISENVKSSLLKQRPAFWDRTYFEGILSFSTDKDVNLLQVSPALGYHFNEALSIGGGPSLLVRVKEKKIDATLGYRVFAKYEFLVLHQKAYLHTEDLVAPSALSEENLKETRHSILAGAGFIAPVSKALGINFCLLYRVNNQNYGNGDASPWVVRIGISSMKSKKAK